MSKNTTKASEHASREATESTRTGWIVMIALLSVIGVALWFIMHGDEDTL